MDWKNGTVGDLLKPSFASLSEDDPKFQPWMHIHLTQTGLFWYESALEAPKWSQLFENESNPSKKQLIQCAPTVRKAALRFLSERYVADVPADQIAKMQAQDVLTNQSKEAERREPMRITVEHYANRSTAKQTDRPRNKQKQRKPRQNHKQTTKYQLEDSSGDDIDVQFEIAKPAPVTDESGTVKRVPAKTSTEKAEIQPPDQPMVTTHCTPSLQCPPSQGVKPHISHRRRKAPNRYDCSRYTVRIRKENQKRTSR